eukprot:TRINITY_DN5462_c0_g1_i2.p1 TRINITY_DN5462_c0_g1~~TRINITY_DN5462_c0_g1_i2.p1  ORF type:complete len:192 (-),score=37.50 TRINITY_DN5462_c0_g1_i2:82-657(-)
MVAVSPVEDIREMVKKLETQELESQLREGRAGAELYGELLAGYIALTRLPEAKFLWKRIPDATKQENAELGKIWEVGKSIWNRDNPRVFQTLQVEWSTPIAPLMEYTLKSFREETIQLVSKAYSSIRISDLTQYIGLDEQATTQLINDMGWSWNQQTGMVTPVCKRKESLKLESLSVQQQRVADFIAYLEN